jgi:HTH-type transcriptional regulator / antitoxin HigA
MEPLKYKVVKTEKQYDEYCDILKELVFSKKQLTPEEEDVVDLLTVLIESWDDEHNTFDELDPVVMLRSFMEDFKMKSVDMAKLLSVSPSLISDVLNYRRGFSKEMIRKLSERFKVDQKLFNRPYALVNSKAKAKKNTKAAAKKPVKPKTSTKAPAKKQAKTAAPKPAKPKPPAKKPSNPSVRINVTRIKKPTKAKA